MPLSVLRENAARAFGTLRERYSRRRGREAEEEESEIVQDKEMGSFLLGEHRLAHWERGTSTMAENVEVDDAVCQMLRFLSTMIAERETEAFTSCLHVCEYLLRKYDLHVRPDLASAWIESFLPIACHDASSSASSTSKAASFGRILALVDLAQLPLWSFLRPYAGRDSPPPTRTFLAKRASRDDAILKVLCRLGKNAAATHCREISTSSSSTRGSRRGVQDVVSFSAGTIVEALHIQSTTMGDVPEPSLRAILPYVLSACSSEGGGDKTCTDWRGWGRLLATTAASKCPSLSVEVRSELCDAIANGISAPLVASAISSVVSFAPSEKEGEFAVSDEEAVDDASGAMAALLSVLVAGGSGDEDDVEGYLYLPKSNGGDQLYLGCDLPSSTYRILTKKSLASVAGGGGDVVAAAIGALSEDAADDDDDDMEEEGKGASRGGTNMAVVLPLLASIASRALGRLETEAAKISNSMEEEEFRMKSDRDVRLLVDLMREPTLRTAWKSARGTLVAATALKTVASFNTLYQKDDKEEPQILDRYRAVLGALHALDSRSRDVGVATAVAAAVGGKSKKKSKKSKKKKKSKKGSEDTDEDAGKKERAARLALLLGYDTDVLDAASSKKGKAAATAADGDEELHRLLLPPRVALEHPDATVRLRAIARLLDYDNGNDGDVDGDDDEGLGRALLRRLATDDDPLVAAAAGDAVALGLELFMRNSHEEDKDEDEVGSDEDSVVVPSFAAALAEDLDALAEEAVVAACKWTCLDTENKEGAALVYAPLLPSLRICGVAANLLLDQSEDGEDDEGDSSLASGTFGALLQTIGAHIAGDADGFAGDVSATAAGALLSLSAAGIQADTEGGNDYAAADAKRFLCRDRLCASVTRKCFGEEEAKTADLPPAIRRNFLGFATDSFSDALRSLGEVDADDNNDDDGEALRIVRGSFELLELRLQHYTAGPTSKALRDDCALCLSRFAANDDREEFVKAIVALASVKSDVAFDTIVKPAMTSGSKDLFDACLHSSAKKNCIVRILAVIKEAFDPACGVDAMKFHLIHTLALLSHPDRVVRENVIELLAFLKSAASDGDGAADPKTQMVWNICAHASDKASPARTSLVMDGANAMPQFLGQVKGGAALQEFLIGGCASVALGEAGFLSGGCQAATCVLTAMEQSGEGAYPLSKRWQFAGKTLFRALLSCNASEIEDVPSLKRLMECVVTMLKGVVVNHLQIGNGSLNDRKRSYSIGGSGDFSILDPYPKDMATSILKALKSGSKTVPPSLQRAVIDLAVGRRSWAEGVFPKLGETSRRDISSALLALRSHHDNEAAGSALQGFPLKAADLEHLLKQVDATKSESDQLGLTFIADCVRGKEQSLGKGADALSLSSGLFSQLSSLSKANSKSANSGGSDYTRMSILQALLDVHTHYKSYFSESPKAEKGSARKRSRSMSDVGSPKKSVAKRPLADHAELLVGLVGGNTTGIKPLASGRGKAVSVSLLTCLCKESPAVVVGSLLPALMNMVNTSRASSSVKNALLVIVPTYCTHAHMADLSLYHLLKTVVGGLSRSEIESNDSEFGLSTLFVNALQELPSETDCSDAVASLISCSVALEAFDFRKLSSSDASSHTRAMLNHIPIESQIAVSSVLLGYAGELMSMICGDSLFSLAPTSCGKMRVDTTEVATLAMQGANPGGDIPSSYAKCTKAQKKSLLFLTVSILNAVRYGVSTPAARKLVRNSQGSQADVCLRLWKDLMHTHSNTIRAHSKLATDTNLDLAEKKFWDAAPLATSECLESIQSLLPVPHFLASVSALLEEESADSPIRRKTIRLLADRVSEVNANSPEAVLFLELVPELLSQLVTVQSKHTSEDAMDVDNEDGTIVIRRTIAMQQGALIAIESFARSLIPSSDENNLAAKVAKVFLPALARIAQLVKKTSSSWLKNQDTSSMLDIGDAESQLLSSAALCASTIVTRLKARCLQLLPSTVNPLVSTLQSVNALFGKSRDTTERQSSSGKMLQLSILRTLSAIADTLPQFILPYLSNIFAADALLSVSLRQDATESDRSVKAAAERLEYTLSNQTQCRLLIPALIPALTVSEKSANWEGALVILRVVRMAIESSERSEIKSVMGKIYKVLVIAYGYNGCEVGRSELIANANNCLLSLVMKLSEAQLRPLYARLREWRGDLEKENDEESTSSHVKRYAFWSLSAELSKSLKSIYLPSLTSAISDAANELELAAKSLSPSSNSTKKNSSGSKRRRVEEQTLTSANLASLKPLQPLLLCLESSLRADAHDGGDWVRGDDNQRYNMILSHLGKLLLAQLPPEFPVTSALSPKESSSTSAYEQLIQGVGTAGHGSVVGCLTALAAAAGNEQLWKPLNFALLEACGNKRSEVRKAGISCLLSIIEIIGEEYMVLLPECLPVLSELLEDGDEEIARMAKECVHQGEELLGESLEDSLR